MKMRTAVVALDGMTRVLLLLLYHTCLGLDVTAPPSQTALFKSRVVLPCTFRVTTPPINPQFLAIIWTHGTKDLLRFDNKEKVVSDGVSFDEQAARQGSASLTIHNVTIANHGTYKCLVIYSPDRTSRDIELNVQATPMVKIHKMGLHRNEKNQVDCFITGFFPMESLIVTWLRNDIKVLGGSKMGTFQPGADGTFRVNSSIILTPDQIQDRPSIICQVEHVSLQKPIQDGFLVTYKVAPIVQLTSSRTADGNEYLYLCKAQGFSPEPLSINWLVDGKMANLSRGREDGLYNKEIYYRIDLKEGNVPEQISCDIEHEALNNPVTKTLKVQSYNECKRHCHLGLTAVLLSLLVLSFVAIAYILRKYIRKKKYLQQFQVSHIHKEHVRGNEEKVNLFCMASKCPDAVKVTWIVREQDQRPIIISESPAIKDEEAGPLINHEYTVKTDQTEDNGLQNATTVLSFNPTKSSHKNTEIKCELQCGERCEERTLNFSFCYKKPSIKGPIDLSLDDSGNVLCSLTLENFYPGDIQIKWNCGVGNNQELPSTEDIKYDNDYTSRCNSICTIPWKHFMGPGSKVRVTWTHRSLDQPGYQELSLKDFPWCPVMDDIEVPSLVHDREAKLQCVIRGYFPDNLEVKWLRREGGKPELYEVSTGDRYKIPVLEITQESDKTYTCTASLIVSVLLKTEHKSEFICRVTHPILETPLEKRTGELTVTGIPTVRKQDGRYLIAEISHFYPEKITVTWSRTKRKSGLENKFVPCDEKKYTVSELRHESDGTFSLTSSVKKQDKLTVDKKTYNENKLYKLTVTHESMKSPIEKTYRKGTTDTFEEVTEKHEETARGEMPDSDVAAQGGGEETPAMGVMQPGKKKSRKKDFNFFPKLGKKGEEMPAMGVMQPGKKKSRKFDIGIGF
ncbi:uncharacterized protein [Aquarana catesbeiana]|uniref:uncharacterized protein n=1 Tax=Aquarana catesbeiana TaxID=8400 RepID=UPI003CC92697